MNTKKLSLAILAVLTVMVVGLAACEKKGPAEAAGEKIDHAADKVGDKLNEAGDKIKDKTD